MPSSRDAITRHMSRTYRRIYEVVRKIPRGRVMTYGQVAAAAGMPRGARVVGYAMHAIGEHVPWQRVLGRRGKSRGGVSIKDPMGGAVQQLLLEKEGVTFGKGGTVDLERYGWGPVGAGRRRK
jgi:methylated-DNA-protein-cysteine methyltransferase-like protein